MRKMTSFPRIRVRSQTFQMIWNQSVENLPVYVNKVAVRKRISGKNMLKKGKIIKAYFPIPPALQ